MIWIATLCLLAVAAWLILNGLNERRWVQAHSHDETVAADEGFLPSFSTTVDKRRVADDGTVSYVPEPTALGRAVESVQTQSAKVGHKIEAGVQQARAGYAERQANGQGAGDIVGRAVETVQTQGAKVGHRIEAGVQQARAGYAERQAHGQGAGDMVGRAVDKVKDVTASVGSQIEPKARKARERADEFRARVSDKLTSGGASASGTAASKDPGGADASDVTGQPDPTRRAD